jgi:hypothetical protein
MSRSSEPRDISRRRMPAAKRLRLTPNKPVVTLGPPRLPGVFSYTEEEWAKVASANPSWSPGIADSSRLLDDLEAASQRYQLRRTRYGARAFRQSLIRDALQAWTIATGDTALGFSRVRTVPAGPLIRFLNTALEPILGTDMVGAEALVQAILRARR